MATLTWDDAAAHPHDLVAADPPWRYDVWSGPDTPRTADRHYATMPFERIARLPVTDLAAADAALLLWVPCPMLKEGLLLTEAWGFSYKTVVFCWEKVNHDGSPFKGMGHYSRANVEVCLLGLRGKGLPVRARDVGQVIRARRREHSRKPDEFYRLTDRLFGQEVSKVELFSRTPWPGWDWVGDEASSFGAQLPLFHLLEQVDGDDGGAL